MCRWPYTTAAALKRRGQSAVASVPHHSANSGYRSTRVGSRTIGKWLTSTVGRPSGSSSVSLASVSASLARHHASAPAYGSGLSRNSSVHTTPAASATSSAWRLLNVPGGRKV